MSHTIIFDAEAGIIIATIRGIVDAPQIQAVMKDEADLTKEHNCYRWMNDLTHAEDRLTTLDIYELPNFLEDIGKLLGIPVLRIKIAVVAPVPTKDHLFAEMVGANRGQSLRVFSDVPTAKDWLSGVDAQKRVVRNLR